MEYWLGSGIEFLSADLSKQYAMILVSCKYGKTLINHKRIFKVNRVIWRPSVFSNVGTSCVRLQIPPVFFFPSFKASPGFVYIAP